MRRLAKLIIATECVNYCEELFSVGNFYHLEDGIKKLCVREDNSDTQMKAGLKMALGTLLRTASDILWTHFCITKQNQKIEDVTAFKCVFENSIPQDIF